MASLRVDRYETLEPIASGGMATVYLGRSLGAGGFQRLVAIKVMHPHLADDPEFVAMFLDEARLAANVRHPNVVPTFDVQRDAGGLFIVMDYIEGASLHAVEKTLRKTGEVLPLPVTLRIFFDALAGLHAAHELVGADGEPLQLVHRDVSPQNILLGLDGIARITDFGIARAESRVTTTRGGQLKGRLSYMSTEQIRNEAVTRQSDVYAAGVVLWEMLTGQHLFRADNDAALMAMVLHGPGRSPRDVNPSIPWEIDEACMRALEPVADRYRTAASFAEALERAASRSGTPIAMPRSVAAFVKRAQVKKAPMTMPPLPERAEDAARKAAKTLVLPDQAPPARSAMTMPMTSPPVFPPPLPSHTMPPQTVAAGPSWTPYAPGGGTPIGTPVSSSSLPIATSTIVPAPEPTPARGGGGMLLAAIGASLVTGLLVWTLTRGGPEPEVAAQPVAAPTVVVASAPSPSAVASAAAAAAVSAEIAAAEALPEASAEVVPDAPAAPAPRAAASPVAKAAAAPRPTEPPAAKPAAAPPPDLDPPGKPAPAPTSTAFRPDEL